MDTPHPDRFFASRPLIVTVFHICLFIFFIFAVKINKFYKSKLFCKIYFAESVRIGLTVHLLANNCLADNPDKPTFGYSPYDSVIGFEPM